MMSTFSPDRQFTLAGPEDAPVVLWRTRKGEFVAVKERNCKFDHRVTAVAWKRVERMVAFSSLGGAQPRRVFYDSNKPPGQSGCIEDW
jgi:hypothetical protein